MRREAFHRVSWPSCLGGTKAFLFSTEFKEEVRSFGDHEGKEAAVGGGLPGEA